MTTTHDRCAALDLTREEAWVVHAAVLATVERAIEHGDEPPAHALEVLSDVESGAVCLGDSGLEVVREALSAHLADAPARDRPAARSALDAVDAAAA